MRISHERISSSPSVLPEPRPWVAPLPVRSCCREDNQLHEAVRSAIGWLVTILHQATLHYESEDVYSNDWSKGNQMLSWCTKSYDAYAQSKLGFNPGDQQDQFLIYTRNKVYRVRASNNGDGLRSLDFVIVCSLRSHGFISYLRTTVDVKTHGSQLWLSRIRSSRGCVQSWRWSFVSSA